ncbi:MAG: hypothetical protein ACR5K7_00585 [Symbiopectobacterium sp.]
MKLDRENQLSLLEEIARIKAGGVIADVPVRAQVRAKEVAEELTS